MRVFLYLLISILLYGCNKQQPESIKIPQYPVELVHPIILEHKWEIPFDLLYKKPNNGLAKLKQLNEQIKLIETNTPFTDPREYIESSPYLYLNIDIEPKYEEFIKNTLTELDKFIFYYKLKYMVAPPNMLYKEYQTRPVSSPSYPSRLSAHATVIISLLNIYNDKYKTLDINDIINSFNLLETDSLILGYYSIEDIDAGRVLATKFLHYYFEKVNPLLLLR